MESLGIKEMTWTLICICGKLYSTRPFEREYLAAFRIND